MRKIQVGDKVIVKKGSGNHNFYEDCGSAEAAYLIITETPSTAGNFAYAGYDANGNRTSNCSGHKLKDSDFILVKSNNSSSNMSIKSTWKNLTRKEPEKSFVKAGVTDSDDTLTQEGQELFIEWLFEQNKAAFNDQVVQPILKEQEENK